MELSSYVRGAVSTESKKDELKVNKDFLEATIKMHVASGNLLDYIKKHMFYNREYDCNNIDKNIISISNEVNRLQRITSDELNDNEVVIDINSRIFHSVLGVATESVELLESLNFDGDDLDWVNMAEEYGDLNWYQAIFCDVTNISWVSILETNANKLYKAKEARFKDGFTDNDANERNLFAERNILEEIEIN